MKISEIIEKAALENDTKNSYLYIKNNLKKGVRFVNIYGRIIKYDSVNMSYINGKNSFRIMLVRDTGNPYMCTFFKFNKDITRRNLRIVCNEQGSYEKKKIMFKK